MSHWTKFEATVIQMPLYSFTELNFFHACIVLPCNLKNWLIYYEFCKILLRMCTKLFNNIIYFARCLNHRLCGALASHLIHLGSACENCDVWSWPNIDRVLNHFIQHGLVNLTVISRTDTICTGFFFWNLASTNRILNPINFTRNRLKVYLIQPLWIKMTAFHRFLQWTTWCYN